MAETCHQHNKVGYKTCVLTYPTPSLIAYNTTGTMHLKITTQVCNEMPLFYTVRRAHIHNFVSYFRHYLLQVPRHISADPRLYTHHRENVSLTCTSIKASIQETNANTTVTIALGKVTTLWLGDGQTVARFPTKMKAFLFCKPSTQAPEPTQPPTRCTPAALCPGVRRTGQEAMPPRFHVSLWRCA